jgi:hypothetical protein
MPRRLPLLLVVVAAAALTPDPAAAAPPGPPGPPPGAGADLPVPPGTAPALVPPGTPAVIPPTTLSGPGLLDGRPLAVDRKRRRVSVVLACQAHGTVRMTAPALGRGVIAAGGYRCIRGRATARLNMTRGAVRRLPRRGTVATSAAVLQSGRTTRISIALFAGARPPAPGFWTDGNLHCAADAPAGAPQAYLAEPDFTTRSITTISTRAWVAWYTDRAGWHWLGVRGEGAGRWHTWTATPTGIAQFHPGGAVTPSPWTWGPLSVAPGQGIHAVGVFEIVYWVAGRPTYRWGYVNAGVTGASAAGGATQYCLYP